MKTYSKHIEFVPQHDQMDCGPACVSMITSYYGKKYSLQYLRDSSYITRDGVSLLGIIQAARKVGFETFSSKLSHSSLLKKENYFPCIIHWNQNHFVVLRKVSKGIFSKKKYYHLIDPSHGFVKISEKKFKQSWMTQSEEGIALFLSPTEAFFETEAPKEEKLAIRYLLNYLIPYRKQIALMFGMLLFGSLLTLIFPFLTEALIDRGINQKNVSLIFMILLAQLGIFLGSIVIRVVRNWLTLYIGTHLSITIISDFLRKVLQLPIRFFDTKRMGDFNQRIQDNARVEEFLTSEGITTFFSIITFSVFFGVLWYYNPSILLIYLALTILAITWSFYWLKKRRLLDFYRFESRSQNQEAIYELYNGITEMKLNQFEDLKRKEWEKLQNKLFHLNIRILKLDQVQLVGFDFINQLKNILVTFLAANLVVQDQMTLGALLSISYIIGQMNSPVDQLVNFFRSLQDAKLSFKRLNEVHNQETEEKESHVKLLEESISKDFADERGIRLENVSYQYEGPDSPFVLENINLLIPEGKITAIVGASGSGKTTLMKLLLRFYDPIKGEIYYNHDNILALSPKSIRENSGVVMQNGYIFSDTIARNVATGDEKIDEVQLDHALAIANIKRFVDGLPLKAKTKIGAAGNGLSGGQRQRILIARAVYKNPHYIFFDEATSALDAENEKVIQNKLNQFFEGKTAVIIAHRLSTVKNADQIIVLNKGKVVERGNHQKLVEAKGQYFNLIKNQLELGG